jgi:hypothetical protein
MIGEAYVHGLMDGEARWQYDLAELEIHLCRVLYIFANCSTEIR